MNFATMQLFSARRKKTLEQSDNIPTRQPKLPQLSSELTCSATTCAVHSRAMDPDQKFDIDARHTRKWSRNLAKSQAWHGACTCRVVAGLVVLGMIELGHRAAYWCGVTGSDI